MNIKNAMLRTTTILIVVFSFVGCENDFDSLGTDIIGEPGFDADLYEEAEISAYTHRLNAVQTNNLPFGGTNSVNLLGVYKDPVFGLQIANVLSQLNLSTPNPSFGTEPVMDSVVLNLPYFSSEDETDEDGLVSYKLDSIYGNSPFRLSIHHSNLYLNTYDPETDFQSPQRYYSNMQPRIENNLTGNVLYENESFLPSADEVVVFGTNEEGERDTLRLAPRMRVKLPNQFFQERILDREGSTELVNNSNFHNFLRGLYFKAEPVNEDGSLMMLNFRNQEAGITLYYSYLVADTEDADDDGDTTELVSAQGSFDLSFGSTIVNTFEQEVPEFNDDNLYLKGGEGSMAVIELFSGPDTDGNNVSDELDYLRENQWLINEANLIFHVNREKMASAREPERLLLYNLDRRTVLADYVLEVPGQQNPIGSVANQGHLGPLQRDEDGNGLRYKIRITDHIRRIINSDSTNVRLGLVVSQNVNLISNAAVLDAGDEDIQRIPVSSVISPLGTVLHGPDADDEEKRLKLRIYYTEPKN